MTPFRSYSTSPMFLLKVDVMVPRLAYDAFFEVDRGAGRKPDVNQTKYQASPWTDAY